MIEELAFPRALTCCKEGLLGSHVSPRTCAESGERAGALHSRRHVIEGEEGGGLRVCAPFAQAAQLSAQRSR